MDRETLTRMPMADLREVGYALEEKLDNETVRSREKSDLVDKILAAAECLESGRLSEVIDVGGLRPAYPSFDGIIVRVAANTTRSGVTINDILVEPPSEMLGGLPHEEVNGVEAARERAEGHCRLNRQHSRSALPEKGAP